MGNSSASHQQDDIYSNIRRGDLNGIQRCLERNRIAVNSKDEVSYINISKWNKLNFTLFSYDQDGWSPLHVACKTGNEDVFNLLIERGADKEARNNVMKWKITNL